MIDPFIDFGREICGDLEAAEQREWLVTNGLVSYRCYHSLTRAGASAGAWRMDIQPVEHGLRVTALEGATPFYLLGATARVEPAEEWYLNFDLPAERFRGLDDHEDHLHAGTFTADLEPGHPLTIVLSTESGADSTHELQARCARETVLLDQWTHTSSRLPDGAPNQTPP